MTSGKMRHVLPVLRGFSVADLVVAAVLVIAAIAVTSDAWTDIVRIAWNDEEASHVLLVPVVAGWTAWSRRSRLRQCRAQGSYFALIGVLAGLILWYIGYSQQRQMFWHAGAVLMTVSCLLVGLGMQVFWRFLPVAGALLFLIPVPSHRRLEIAIPLQNLTAGITQSVGEVLGMSITQSGNLLSINGVDVTVAEACNGMRMVFTLLLVCYAFAFTMPLRASVRIAILVLSPAVSVVANVMRLIPTIWAYGALSPEWAEWIHDASGWVMLFVAFITLTGLVKVLRWAMVPVCRFNLSLA